MEKYIKYIILVLSLSSIRFSSAGQVTFQEKAFRLDSKNKFICSSTSDYKGNVLFSGLIRKGTGNSHTNMLLLLKPNTDTLWTRKGPDVSDYFIYQGVRPTVGGNFVFATTIASSNPAPDYGDVLLKKISRNGTTTWGQPFNPAGDWNDIKGLLVMADQGYLIGGYGGIPGTNSTATLTHIDSVGNIIWHRN